MFVLVLKIKSGHFPVLAAVGGGWVFGQLCFSFSWWVGPHNSIDQYFSLLHFAVKYGDSNLVLKKNLRH